MQKKIPDLKRSIASYAKADENDEDTHDASLERLPKLVCKLTYLLAVDIVQEVEYKGHQLKISRKEDK